MNALLMSVACSSLPFQRGFDEAAEERVGVVGARFELGVELAGDEVRVRRDLDQFDQVFFGIVDRRSSTRAVSSGRGRRC